jgi:hypothetical protein
VFRSSLLTLRQAISPEELDFRREHQDIRWRARELLALSDRGTFRLTIQSDVWSYGMLWLVPSIPCQLLPHIPQPGSY